MLITEKLPTAEEFYNLFETTGWNTKYELTKENLYKGVTNSWYSISIYDNNLLVGFGRVISDGVCHALILDVIIRPEKQGKGLGKTIMDKIVLKCKENKIRDIQLFSAKNKAGFYHKLGFVERKEHSPGMELERYW